MNNKLELWSEKLLDCGKGNRLINYKDIRQQSVAIIAPSSKDIFNRIRSGQELSFFDIDKYIQTNKNTGALHDEDDIDVELSKRALDTVSSDLTTKQILAYKSKVALKGILTNIKKSAKESLTERGINILYITFGFLKWRENDHSNIFYKSPLCLIPVSLKNGLFSEPFTIVRYEEEVIVNETLKYRLKNDFNVELPDFLPEYTLTSYLTMIKKLISGNSSIFSGWEMHNEVALSIFSFSKMDMFADLKNNQSRVLANPNIKNLINTDREGTVQYESLPADFFQKSDDVKTIHNVVNADSSQVEAIATAKIGNSLVIQGPPGTGKSQTITNLIAEFLHDGKSILFVSEKLTALKVVMNNLTNVGLAEFCLPLHSSKTNKKDVVRELHQTLDIPINDNEELNDIDSKIAALLHDKEELDVYNQKLHTKQDVINLTLYQIIGQYSKCRNSDDINIKLKNIENKGKDYLDSIIVEIDEYKRLVPVVGEDFHKNCWYGLETKALRPGRVNLKNSLETAKEIIFKIKDIVREIHSKYQLNLSKIVKIESTMNLFMSLIEVDELDVNLFDSSNFDYLLVNVSELARLEVELIAMKNEVAASAGYDIYNFDILKLTNQFAVNSPTVKKKLEAVLNNKFKPNDVKLILDKCGETVKLQTKFNDLIDELQTFLKIDNFSYNFKNLIDNLLNFQKELEINYKYNSEFFNKLNAKIFSKLKVDMKNYVDMWKKLDLKHLDNLQKYFDEDIFDIRSSIVDIMAIRISNCLKTFDELDYWLQSQKILAKLDKLDVYDFIIKSIENRSNANDLDNSFRKIYYAQWLEYLISKIEVFREFESYSHDDVVQKYKEKDKLQYEISKMKIINKLRALKSDLPATEVGILKKENEKKQKHLTIRELLAEIPNLVRILKPCILMSPLSVSTYFSDNDFNFDVVIFDEASQIFPWDALGAIYRAKQLIVVGDSKQMPPSEFFSSGGSTDIERDDEVEDDPANYDSILDLCKTMFNEKRLNYHYRSKVESLIAFSNKNFYYNQLITFPANRVTSDDGLQFYHVPNGVYDRERRINANEAKRVVDLIYEHYETRPDRSLGVLAFNSTQQQAIENALIRKRRTDDKFASFFDSEVSKEPFFIKNLETIQGDERDVIIFSVSYAKDKDGKFIYNFGPLNKKFGERRLNVAVTRAKYSLKLVTSIRGMDLDPNRTKNEGPKLLKEYLTFAENGYLPGLNMSNNAEYDFMLERSIRGMLKEEGYKVDVHVGTSGYKIDLAVKHPKFDAYVLAIECDGVTYHGAKSTRDRDVLRQGILKAMGWNFYRIWSTGWFKNPNLEKDKLLDAVKEAVKQYDIENNIVYEEEAIQEEADNLQEVNIQENIEKSSGI